MSLTIENSAAAAERFIDCVGSYPNRYHGRGIVICAGGVKYNTCAWVLINILRELGCELPIEVWYLGENEGDPHWINLVKPLGVQCIDAFEVRKRHPHPRLKGWPLKPYAIQHSSFKEVLFLDADNVPVRDPSFLFDTVAYQETGTIFWPDPAHLKTSKDSIRWKIFGLPYRPGPDQESGQLIIDKQRTWQALNLCNWYNKHSEFFYKYIYGDKDTFRFAWQRLNQPIIWPEKYADDKTVKGTLCQHDLDGEVLFQHRFSHKWSLYRDNLRIPNFIHEDRCLEHLDRLREQWSPAKHLLRNVSGADQQQMTELAGDRFHLEYVGQNSWPITLAADGHIIEGGSYQAMFWWVKRGFILFADYQGRVTCRLRPTQGNWQGYQRKNRKRLMRLTSLEKLTV